MGGTVSLVMQIVEKSLSLKTKGDVWPCMLTRLLNNSHSVISRAKQVDSAVFGGPVFNNFKPTLVQGL